MSKGQLLLLDVNLLLPWNMDPLFLKMKEESNFSAFNKEQELLSGVLHEDGFWQEIKKVSKADDYTVQSWQDWWREEQTPIIDGKQLESWRKKVNIGISGNAFAPWVRRSLKDADILRHLRYIWLSSETGQLLPDPDAFSAPFALGLETLYVDDASERLEVAGMYDFSVLEKDDDWLGAINLWID